MRVTGGYEGIVVDIPGNSSTNRTISVGGSLSDSLEVMGDHDWIRIQLTAGQSISVLVDGLTLEDPYLRIRDANGNVIYENDDITPGEVRDSLLAFTATYTGTYFIDVGAWVPDPGEEPPGYTGTGTYTVSVTPYTPPPLGTVQQLADYLVSGHWNGEQRHFNVTPGGSITVNLTALTAPGQTLAIAALAAWTDIIGIQFVQVSSGGQITFDDNQEGAFSTSIRSNGIITSSHVNVSVGWLADNGTSLNGYSFQTYIHEIGHALGLGHQGGYNGEARYPYDAEYQNDGWPMSVMSYFDQRDNTYFSGQGFNFNFITTPMMADILAMSMLYGLSTTTRAGDTVYGTNWSSTMGALCIFDSGGIDTINVSSLSGAHKIDLNPGSFSNVLGEVGNVSIALGVTIENAIGGLGADTLIGNAASNLLDGGAGADTMSAGPGSDVYYVDNMLDAVIEISGQGWDEVRAYGSYTLAPLADIESLVVVDQGSTTNLNLVGNGMGQQLIGNAGANVLTGLGGDDVLVGNAGNDTLDGGTGIDSMSGGAGNDLYIVDHGGDLVIDTSGQGTDEVRASVHYVLPPLADVELLRAIDLASDTPIELVGNGMGQSLIGNAGNNLLNGLGGDDFLTGNAGNDVMDGGTGDDILAGGTGSDLYYVDSALDFIIETSGQGVDEVRTSVSYTLAPLADIETLRIADANSNGALQLTGNGMGQTLIGNAGNNLLSGLGGDDVLIGNAGHDVMDGGTGNDTLAGGIGNDLYFVDSALDFIVETSGQGVDEVRTSVDYTLAPLADIETLRFADSSSTGAYQLIGNGMGQTLIGNAGNNLLFGLGGDDTLTGGAGRDTFVFTEIGWNDRITDFEFGLDVIDLSQIDAVSSAPGDQAFTYIGDASFSGIPGQVRSFYDGSDYYLSGDVNGDRVSDFLINLGSGAIDGSHLIL